MANEEIATYLNDHLAGSVTALKLLDYLEELHTDTPLQCFFAELRADVTADRQELEALMRQLQITLSRTRQATAWVAEKIAEVKIRMDDPAGGALQVLEALEALALGIEGKQALWRALRAVAEEGTRLQGVDYDRLMQRAAEQRHRVEVVRLEAAKQALRLTAS